VVDKERQIAIGKLKPMLTTKRQWDAFCSYVDILVEEQQRKLEQASDLVSIHRAQGSIEMLRKLKYMREEVKD
jgi:hypothetical protein